MAGYETAIVQLCSSAPGMPTVGMGMLVGDDQVVTCAHVVNTALGRDQREQACPGEQDWVHVAFPQLPGVAMPPVRLAQVTMWLPPESSMGGGDVAGLLLTEKAPDGATPARFAAVPPDPGTSLRVFGYPGFPLRETGSWVDVELKGAVGGQLIQVESRGGDTVKAQPGYSGSPVWAAGSGEAVGLLEIAPPGDEPEHDAYLLKPAAIAAAWEAPFDYLLIPESPYRGLEPFTAEHAAVFFGRDDDIHALAARVSARPVTIVVGPSGVGKSSLVQAGLIPALLRQQQWTVVLVRPGLDPWPRLAVALLRAQRGPAAEVTLEESQREIDQLRSTGFGAVAEFLRSENRPLLVVVDQFEELLSTDRPPDQKLLDLLLPPPDAFDAPWRLVLTLRADFQPTLQSIPGFHIRLNERLYLLSPLTTKQMRQAVERPAAARGVAYQPGLVDEIISDAASGALPLLEFTLTKLWETQRSKTLSFAGYHEMGRVRGALDRFAEENAAQLNDTAADVLDRVLLRLVRTPVGAADLATRQRVVQSELSSLGWDIVLRLAEARLVILGTDSRSREPYAELAHESLITAWGRLRHLVADNAEFLNWLARIQERAADGDPLPEARIAEARRWLDTQPENVPDAVREFIQSSETEAEARLRELEDARDRAEAAARRAEAMRLAADAELARHTAHPAMTVALALGAESVLTEPTVQGDLALRNVLRLHPLTLARLVHEGPVNAVAFAPDGTRVMTGSGDSSARLFDPATGTELARLVHEGPVNAVAFAPDGTRVMTGSGDGSARLFDPATGTELARLVHEGPVNAVAFAPDGTRVMTGSGDSSARLFDPATGTELARLVHEGPVNAVAFAPDGTRVMTGSEDSSARLFDPATGTELARLVHEGPVNAVAFAPDGTRVMTGSGDGSARLFDPATGTELARLDHGGWVRAVTFSQDGTRVATASADNSARVFDPATGAELARLDHGNWVWTVAFSPDGTRLATGSSGGSARVFDAVTGAELARLDHDGRVTAVAFAPDGTRVVSGSRDNSARVFDPVTNAELVRLGHGDWVRAVAFSPDGTRVATASDDNWARVFDAATGAELARLRHGSWVTAVAFAPDGTRVATASDDNSARVFDAATGAELARLDHDGRVTAVAFAPDGTRVATASRDGSARVFDPVTNAELGRLEHDGPVNALAFSPDGTRVATGSRDRSARLFDPATGEQLDRLDHEFPVTAVAFAPDGSQVATGSADGPARLFDSATGVELARLNHDGWVRAVAFSPDGTRVATGSADNSARVFDPVTGVELARLYHDFPVTAVAFSPDGTRVVTAGGDISARVFDPVTGVELARLNHDGPVNAVAFAPDGTRVATGSRDGSARIFEASADLLIRRAFDVMSRPLNGAELRRYSLPLDCRHVNQWNVRTVGGGARPTRPAN